MATRERRASQYRRRRPRVPFTSCRLELPNARSTAFAAFCCYCYSFTSAEAASDGAASCSNRQILSTLFYSARTQRSSLPCVANVLRGGSASTIPPAGPSLRTGDYSGRLRNADGGDGGDSTDYFDSEGSVEEDHNYSSTLWDNSCHGASSKTSADSAIQEVTDGDLERAAVRGSRHEDLRRLVQDLEDSEFTHYDNRGTRHESLVPRSKWKGNKSWRQSHGEIAHGLDVEGDGGRQESNARNPHRSSTVGGVGGKVDGCPGLTLAPPPPFPAAYSPDDNAAVSKTVSCRVDVEVSLAPSSTAEEGDENRHPVNGDADGVGLRQDMVKDRDADGRDPGGGDFDGQIVYRQRRRFASHGAMTTEITEDRTEASLAPAGLEKERDIGGTDSFSLSLLHSDFSDTGSAGTWTDGDTDNDLPQRAYDSQNYFSSFGYSRPSAGSSSGLVVGSIIQPATTAPRGHLSTLDLDYSGKVLDYGRRAGVGPPKALTLRSWGRLAGSAGIAMTGAFLAVSPNNAPRNEYLALFRRNLGLLAMSMIGPAVYSFLLYDSKKANINTYVNVFTFAFTWGYLLTFALEIVVATAFQLMTLAAMEPAAFKLCPGVPAIFLPWLLREHGYRPSRLYSCVADLLSLCVGAPIVECTMMVWIVRKLGALPSRRLTETIFSPTVQGSFTTHRPTSASAPPVNEPVEPSRQAEMKTAGITEVSTPTMQYPNGQVTEGDASQINPTSSAMSRSIELEPTHVHTYLLYILGSAMGLKAACTMQRVLVYTREVHEHKTFFALARGFFPLYELCGSIIAMNLAKREILGDRVSSLQLYFVAVALNAYAVFRGTKPVFKWTAFKPWDELQVKAWVFHTGMSPFQRVSKGFASVAWSLVVLKVTAHVIKTYWRLNRLHSSRLRQLHEAV